jgi:WD40 repeat protein
LERSTQLIIKDSDHLLASYLDKSVVLWSIEKRQVIRRIQCSDIITCMEPHPQHGINMLATGSLDKLIRVFDFTSERLVDWHRSEDYITALAYSPLGEYLIVGLYHGICRVYNSENYLSFKCEINCHNTSVKEIYSKKVINIRFLNIVEFIISTCDSRIRLFSTGNFNHLMLKYKGHDSNGQLIQSDVLE